MRWLIQVVIDNRGLTIVTTLAIIYVLMLSIKINFHFPEKKKNCTFEHVVSRALVTKNITKANGASFHVMFSHES